MMRWWENAVFYQIYPRSFLDANGDGVGDLAGIEAGLPYLKRLGVNALWISPFYPSPMRDFGYDISDYCGVDPLFGSMDDFKRLLAAAHGLGIRIVLDLVINHTSDEHPWFIEARSSKENPRHDWYIWKPIRRGLFGRLKKPNNWVAQFELKSAWWPNRATDEFFLGTFTRNQPEVNWRNRELREAMYGVIRFWLDLGVDGFRMDVVNWYVKDARFPSNPRNLVSNPDLFQKHIHDRNQPEVHEICREIRAIADSYPGDRVLVGEIFSRNPVEAASYHGQKLDELHMAFNMELLYQKWSAPIFRDSIRRWYAALPEGAWPNFTLSNHDQPRHFSRLGGRGRGENLARARVAAALLLTLRGTPFIYYGEEIGMEQVNIKRKDLRDPLGIKTWPLKSLGRDGERTPLQWSSGAHAGFSEVSPWLPVAGNWETVNIGIEEDDPRSLYSWYHSLIRRRAASAALGSGSIRFVDGGDPSVIAYLREAEGVSPPSAPDKAPAPAGCRVLVVLNFSAKPRALPPEAAALAGALGNAGALGPYEVRILGA